MLFEVLACSVVCTMISTIFWALYYGRSYVIEEQKTNMPAAKFIVNNTHCSCSSELLKSIKELLNNTKIRHIEVSDDMLISPDVVLPYRKLVGVEISFFKKCYVVYNQKFDYDSKIELGDIVFAYNEGDKIYLLPLNDPVAIIEAANKLKM